MAAVRDIVGGKSGAYTNKLESIKEQCIEQIKVKTSMLDGDAIIGTSIDVEEISGMLMITVTGTAVITSRNHEKSSSNP